MTSEDADHSSGPAAAHGARIEADAVVVVAGLAGQAAGFGVGGIHGYRALEGTFLGGCLFSGRAAGRAAASAL